MRPMFLKIAFFLIVLVAALWLYFSNVALMYQKQIGVEVSEFRQHAAAIPNKIYSHHDLIGLPNPVQRYAEYAGVLGGESVKFAHLKHTGFFRTFLSDL